MFVKQIFQEWSHHFRTVDEANVEMTIFIGLRCSTGLPTVNRTWIISQGSIFRSENDIYSPLLLKMIFFPLSRHVIFKLPSWPFCLNSSLFCNYFTFTSRFLIFFPHSSFSFPFLPFSFTFSPLVSSLFHIFSPK
jgi:hypothetical protein